MINQMIVSFSGRKNGNCDEIAQFISSDKDRIVYFRDLNIHPCSKCNYECFNGECKYRSDDIYGLYSDMLNFDRVILIVPIYCDNPTALYYTFNERSQDYFMHNETYEKILDRLYIIGIYGSKGSSPNFIPYFENMVPYKNHVLGIERHLYGQKIRDHILDVPEVQMMLKHFLLEEAGE